MRILKIVKELLSYYHTAPRACTASFFWYRLSRAQMGSFVGQDMIYWYECGNKSALKNFFLHLKNIPSACRR